MRLWIFRKVLAFVAVCLLVLSLAGCPGSGSSKSSSTTASVTAADIIGTWKQMTSDTMDVSLYNMLTVFDASTYTMTQPYINSDNPACSESGTWSLSGSTLNLSPSPDSTCNDTAPYSVTITSYDGTMLTMNNRGSIDTLQKQANNNAAILGTWSLLSQTLNGTPQSESAALIITSSGYTLNWGAEACTETGTWTLSGTTFKQTITQTTCSDQSIGGTRTATIAVSGNTLTQSYNTSYGPVTNLWQPSTATGVPAAPTGVQVVAGDGIVTLSWTSVPGATDYYIYVSDTSGVSKTNYGQKLTNNTSPQGLNGFNNGTTYYFIVTAVNANGESAASAQVSATPSASGSTTNNSVPAAPTGVQAVADNGKITISWTAVTGATSYNIYWSMTTSIPETNGNVIQNQTSPAVLNASNGTTYYFIVTALNVNGESAASAQVTATPQLPAPTSVAATTDGIPYGSMQISWNTVSGATSYNVYASTTKGVTKATGTKHANMTSPATFTGTAGTTYYFVVTAQDATSESAESAQLCAIPQDGFRYYIPCNPN
jgi:Fibronectin type III domain